MRDGWTQTCLGEIADWYSGGTPKATDARFYEGGEIPWAVIADVADGPISGTERHITSTGLEAIGGRLAPIGSVLVTMYGTIGRTALVATPMATNQAIAWAVTRDQVLPEFLFLVMRNLGRELDAQGRGATQRNINRQIIRDQPVLVPPLDEQRRIVDLIDAVDATADEASTLVSSAMEAVERLSTALIEGSTDTVALGDLLLDIDGGRSPVTEGRAPIPGEPSVLKLSAIRPARFDVSERKALVPGTEMPSRAIAKDGDVLITRSNTASSVGYACQVDGADGLTYLSDLTLRLHPVPGQLDPAYLTEVLCSRGLRSQIEGSARGTSGSMRKISRELIRGYMIPLLPMDRQRQVAGDLRAMRTLGDRAERELQAIRQLRSALLHDLLSGDHEIPSSYDALLEAV